MRLESKTYLQFAHFSNLTNWSVQHNLEQKASYSDQYKLIPIGSFLSRSRTILNIKDDSAYQRVTVKIRNGGVYLRDIKKGCEIGTKKQFVVSDGQFIISKIDARNGAMGIIPKELSGAIVTNDFPLYDINTSIINSKYFVLIITTDRFLRFVQSCSSGTTNRQRIDMDVFLSQKIPLPSLAKQNKLVEEYNSRIREAEVLELQAKDLEKEIEDYLFEKLKVKKMKQLVFEKCKLNLFYYSDFIDRWDINKISTTVINNTFKSIYPIFTLGEVLKFESRSWDKKKCNSETFEYIELNSVHPLNGIVKTSTMLTKNAPSRATQIVKSGDLIIGTTRPYLKKFAIIHEKDNNKVASSGFQVIRQDKNYNLNFVIEFLFSDLAVQQFEFYMTGALYPAITSKDLKKVQIPFPPQSLQDEIANHIQNIRDNIKSFLQCAEKKRKDAIIEFENEIFK